MFKRSTNWRQRFMTALVLAFALAGVVGITPTHAAKWSTGITPPPVDER